MSTDKVADMLTRIRNAYLAKNASTVIPHTKLLEEVARVMKEEGYLASYKVITNDKGFKDLQVKLVYTQDDKPAVHKINRISKPGLRIYKSSKDLHPVLSDLGISIITTSQGVMTNKQAKKLNIGGEVLCELW